MSIYKILEKIVKVDWVVDEDGDLVCRLWGRIGIGHYKWQDGAIWKNAMNMKPVAKRGVDCKTEDGEWKYK